MGLCLFPVTLARLHVLHVTVRVSFLSSSSNYKVDHVIQMGSRVQLQLTCSVCSSSHKCPQCHHAGLEIFFIDAGGSASGPSVFFAFGSELERDDAAAAIANQPSVGANLPGGRAVASACGSILEVNPHSRALLSSWSFLCIYFLIFLANAAVLPVRVCASHCHTSYLPHTGRISFCEYAIQCAVALMVKSLGRCRGGNHIWCMKVGAQNGILGPLRR